MRKFSQIILLFTVFFLGSTGHAKNAMIILGSGYEQDHELGFSNVLQGEWDIYSIDTKDISEVESYFVPKSKTVYRIQIKSDKQLLSLVNNIMGYDYTKYNVIDSIHYLGSEQSEIIRVLLQNNKLDVKSKIFISPLMQNSTLSLVKDILPAAQKEINDYFKFTYGDSKFVKVDALLKVWSLGIKQDLNVIEFIEKCATALRISEGIEMTASDKFAIGKIFNSYINYDAITDDLFIE